MLLSSFCSEYKKNHRGRQVALRVLFFGMEGIFSRAPLLALIDASFEICAVIVPRPTQIRIANEPIRLIPPPHAPESDVPLLFQPRDLNVSGIAWNAGIDVYETADLRHQKSLETLISLKPDVICVACFPLLLPKSLISRPSIPHALNLHPSLLPAYRGPAPLFWVFHDGLEHAGVTIHLIDKGADTGDIVAQERVLLPDGTRYSDAERTLSDRAGQMLVHSLRAIENGTLAHTPQSMIAAPRAPNPTDRDYVITTDWTARRAFNFVRGIAEWNHPITLEIANRRLVVRDAIAYDARGKLGAPFLQGGDSWRVQFENGTLTCALTPYDY